MTSAAEFSSAIRAAEQELKLAKTADDIRNLWRKHFSIVGHRALGRLLVGRSADEQLARRADRRAD